LWSENPAYKFGGDVCGGYEAPASSFGLAKEEGHDRSENGGGRGCQIFLGTKYQNGKNIPNYHKLYQMSIKYNKRQQITNNKWTKCP
jgi:hypothetical protein